MARDGFSNTIPLSETTKFIVDNRGKTAPTAEKGIALIATNCITNDHLYPLYEKLRFVSQETYDTWFRAHPKPGDILLTNKGSQNGAICLVPDPVNFVIAQDMVAIRANEEVIDPLFLFAALRSPDVQAQIKNLDVSGVIPHFKKTDFDKLLLPYPNRHTQKEIGRIYFELCAKIELNRRMNETLEAMARALFKSWFVDFDPVRAKAEGRDPGLPKSLADLFPNSFEDSELRDIPKGWEPGPFAGTIEILGGGTPKTSSPEYWNGAIPWFSIVDAPSDTDVWVIDTEKKITQAGVENSSTQILPVGTTIITARGTVGRIALVGVPMAMNQSCYGLRGKADMHGYYTYFATRQLVSSLQQRAHGSVFDTITRDTFAGVTVVIPPPHLVEAFEKIVSPTLDRIRAGLFVSSTLAALCDALLPKLISGELRINDAERIIGKSM